MVGTYGRLRDTRNPLWVKEFYNKHGFYPICGAEDEPVTFTQEQVDEKVNTAVAASKSGSGTFFDGFAPEIKGHPDVVRYKSVEEMAKGHIELGKTIGLKGTLIPTENSSDEVKAKYFKDIGRPDLAENYINPSYDGLHEGVKSSGEQDTKAFKDKAFELGLSGKQYDELNKWYLGLQSQRLTDWDKLQTDERNTTVTALRNKWGGSFDERNALVDGLVNKFGPEGLFDKLRKNPDPLMTEFLHNIGSQLSEDKLGELGRSNMGMTPESAKVEINQIMKLIDETKQDDPTYQDLLKRSQTLYKIAYPRKVAA